MFTTTLASNWDVIESVVLAPISFHRQPTVFDERFCACSLCSHSARREMRPFSIYHAKYNAFTILSHAACRLSFHVIL